VLEVNERFGEYLASMFRIEGKKVRNFLEEGSKKMSGFMLDLLFYSKKSSSETSVDLQKIIRRNIQGIQLTAFKNY
jgi:hypothetical protein